MRNRFVLLADVMAIGIAAVGAFVLRFDLLFLSHRPEFLTFLVASLCLKPVVFYGFGLYRRYWRYTSLNDLRALTLASLAASALMAVVEAAALSARLVPEFSRAVLTIDCMLTFIGIAGIRISVRVVGESRSRTRGSAPAISAGIPPRKRVLVVGAGEAGSMVVREMQRNPQLGMQPIGFLDDDPVKRGKQIHGVRVLGDIASLKRASLPAEIDEVTIAMPTASGQAVRAVVERCQALGLRSRTIPGVFELLDGKVRLNRLRHVDIADLLRRTQVTGRATSSYLEGRTVLVTGAGGSIGFELCRQVAYARPKRLVMLGHGENSMFDAHAQLRESFADVPISIVIADIRDAARIGRVFTQFDPQVVFHAAAHKHVHLMEENPEEAILNNVVGTQNVVDAAIASNTERFVAISSDKAVSPNGMMGASKRVGDMLVRIAGEKTDRPFVVVRFGNVLGSRGSVVPSFKRQIERGGPITITHPEMKRFFMTIGEAVHLVLEAGGMGKPGELFVLNMGEPVRIVSLAEDLIRLSGLSPDQIPIVFTGPRPGEKMEERLWERDSIVEPTVHSDILRVTERTTINASPESVVRTLEMAAARGDRVTIQTLLRQYIPTFTPVSQAEPRTPDTSTVLKWNAGLR